MKNRLLILAMEFPPGPGGMGTLIYQVAHHLSQLGWDVSVSTPQNFAGISEITQFNQAQPFTIHPITYQGPFLLEVLDRLWQGWQLSRKHDLILAINEKTVILGAILSILTGKPLVAIGCGTEFLRGNKWYKAVTRWGYNRATHRIQISEFAGNLATNLGINTQHTTIIPCGADDTQFFQTPQPDPTFRQKMGLAQAKIILTVGQVSPRKAQDIVIRAMPAILTAHPHTHYLIAGLPTHQTTLEQLAQSLGVSDHIHFLGRVSNDQLVTLYNTADLFVLVSRATDGGDVEGYGIVVNEAGLCGLPAVVASNSGLVEAVVPDNTAIVVPPEDPQATATAIIALFNNEARLQEMGQASKTYTQAVATWQKRGQQYDQLLRDLLES